MVRALEPGDFRHLRRLEREIRGQDAEEQACPFCLRLCTEHYPDWCFLAFEDDRPVGYVLNFPREKVNYCAALNAPSAGKPFPVRPCWREQTGAG